MPSASKRRALKFVVPVMRMGASHAADAGVRHPQQRMPPVKNLEQRLQKIHPYITTAQMNQFVQQHRAQLLGGKFLR